MDIYLAKTEDIIPLSEVWLQYVHETFPDSNPRSDWFIDSVTSLLSESNYYLLLSKLDNNILGFLETMFIKDMIAGVQCPLVHTLYVKPDYLGLGIAEQLQRTMYRICSHYDHNIIRIMAEEPMINYWLSKDYHIKSAILESRFMATEV